MIGLSDAGRERLAEMRHSLGTSVLPMLSSLSRKDQKALREGVEAMRRLMAQEQSGLGARGPGAPEPLREGSGPR